MSSNGQKSEINSQVKRMKTSSQKMNGMDKNSPEADAKQRKEEKVARQNQGQAFNRKAAA